MKNIRSSYKACLIILLALIVLGTLQVKCYAEENNFQEEDHSKIYQLIDKFDYLVVPTINTLVGGILCWPWCSLVGGGIGIADEALVHFNYTNKRYLSYGFLGLITGDMVYPGNIPKFVGFVIGVLLPTGLPKKIVAENQWIAAPTISAIANYKFGAPGMIAGGIGGAVDEFALANNYYDKHYMTFVNVGGLVGGLALQPLLGGAILANFIGVGVGLIAANWEEDICNNFITPVNTTKKIYEIISKFIPAAQLDSHIEQHGLVLIGSQIITQFFVLKIANHEQDLTYAYEHLDDLTPHLWNQVEVAAIRMAVFMVPYGLSCFVSELADSYFDKKISYILRDNARTNIYSGENVLALTYYNNSNNNASFLLDQLEKDIKTAADSGDQLMTNAASSLIKGVHGFSTIIAGSPNIAIYVVSYNQVSSIIAKYFADKKKEYEEIDEKLKSSYSTIVKNDHENIKTIVERGGMGFTRDRMREVSAKIEKNEEEKDLLEMEEQIWDKVSAPINFILSYYLIAKEIYAGKIAFDERNNIYLAVSQASNLLSWQVDNAKEIAKVGKSINHLNTLEDMIKLAKEGDNQLNYSFNDTKQLVLKNLEIGVKNNKQLLYKTDEIALDMGKVYAITGSPGSGKSSLIAKIKGISAGPAYAKGDIIYPLINGIKPKIVMMSQKNYFPLNASLKEILMYPDKFPSDQDVAGEYRKKMLMILNEAFVASSKETQARIEDLDSVIDNTYNAFSGGEQKLLLLISIILQEPNIVLLDEVFAGLGEFTPIAQKLIKKYLPNALILSVDHEANKHNLNFYDADLHVNTNDKKLILQAS
jgi:ABC-type uncharacterized transport system fused permease/ATPase subunit